MKKHMKWVLALVTTVAVAAFGILHRGHAEPVLAAHYSAVTAGDGPLVTVYSNPTCACCGDWADHLRKSGFRVKTVQGADLNRVKNQHGVTMDLASCHSAEVAGYGLEGHVPAGVIRQLLVEQPAIRGLSVPGMPAGVEGMPPAGPNRAPYEIFAIQQGGGSRLYASR